MRKQLGQHVQGSLGDTGISGRTIRGWWGAVRFHLPGGFSVYRVVGGGGGRGGPNVQGLRRYVSWLCHGHSVNLTRRQCLHLGSCFIGRQAKGDCILHCLLAFQRDLGKRRGRWSIRRFIEMNGVKSPRGVQWRTVDVFIVEGKQTVASWFNYPVTLTNWSDFLNKQSPGCYVEMGEGKVGKQNKFLSLVFQSGALLISTFSLIDRLFYLTLHPLKYSLGLPLSSVVRGSIHTWHSDRFWKTMILFNTEIITIIITNTID